VRSSTRCTSGSQTGPSGSQRYEVSVHLFSLADSFLERALVPEDALGLDATVDPPVAVGVRRSDDARLGAGGRREYREARQHRQPGLDRVDDRAPSARSRAIFLERALVPEDALGLDATVDPPVAVGVRRSDDAPTARPRSSRRPSTVSKKPSNSPSCGPRPHSTRLDFQAMPSPFSWSVPSCQKMHWALTRP
jgi:hypothetical protein